MRNDFISGNFYHVFSRSNGEELLFRNDDNYKYFLSKYIYYLHTMVNTYAYCLMPNHFHFLIQVEHGYDGKKDYTLNAFSKLLNSYSKSYNKYYNRNGSLFQKGIKRKQVTDSHYLSHVIAYIHTNPVKHHLLKEYGKWPYSSHQEIINNESRLIDIKVVMDLFGSKSHYIEKHHSQKEELINTYLLE